MKRAATRLRKDPPISQKKFRQKRSLILIRFAPIRFTAENSTVSAVFAVGASIGTQWQQQSSPTTGHHLKSDDEEHSSRAAVGIASARASIVAASPSGGRTWFIGRCVTHTCVSFHICFYICGWECSAHENVKERERERIGMIEFFFSLFFLLRPTPSQTNHSSVDSRAGSLNELNFRAKRWRLPCRA